MTPKMPPPFDSIDPWDEKYDYVMHDDHWLSSKWSADCEKCRAAGKKPSPPLIANNVTPNNVTSNNVPKPFLVADPAPSGFGSNFNATITKTHSATNTMMPAPSTNANHNHNAANATIDSLAGAVKLINITSSPVKNSHNMSTTLKNDTTRYNSNMEISPPPAGPPPVTIAMTPIAHPSMSTRAFMTPYTASKFGGNETFNRTTRQSAKKLLSSQNAEKDLLDLNETFDLYRSCLTETPQLSQQSSPQNDIDGQQQQQQQHHQQHHTQQQQHQQQQSSSRIPKIPVRMPK